MMSALLSEALPGTGWWLGMLLRVDITAVKISLLLMVSPLLQKSISAT